MMDTRQVLEKIVQERKRQNEKWGDQQHPDLIWYLILNEELGEIAKEILENDEYGSGNSNVMTELIQAAAVIVAWLEDMTRHEEFNND